MVTNDATTTAAPMSTSIASQSVPLPSALEDHPEMLEKNQLCRAAAAALADAEARFTAQSEEHKTVTREATANLEALQQALQRAKAGRHEALVRIHAEGRSGIVAEIQQAYRDIWIHLQQIDELGVRLETLYKKFGCSALPEVPALLRQFMHTTFREEARRFGMDVASTERSQMNVALALKGDANDSR